MSTLLAFAAETLSSSNLLLGFPLAELTTLPDSVMERKFSVQEIVWLKQARAGKKLRLSVLESGDDLSMYSVLFTKWQKEGYTLAWDTAALLNFDTHTIERILDMYERGSPETREVLRTWMQACNGYEALSALDTTRFCAEQRYLGLAEIVPDLPAISPGQHTGSAEAIVKRLTTNKVIFGGYSYFNAGHLARLPLASYSYVGVRPVLLDAYAYEAEWRAAVAFLSQLWQEKVKPDHPDYERGLKVFRLVDNIHQTGLTAEAMLELSQTTLGVVVLSSILPYYQRDPAALAALWSTALVDSPAVFEILCDVSHRLPEDILKPHIARCAPHYAMIKHPHWLRMAITEIVEHAQCFTDIDARKQCIHLAIRKLAQGDIMPAPSDFEL